MKYSWIGLLTALFMVPFPFFLSSDILYGTANAKFFWVIGLVVVAAVVAAVQLLRDKKFELRASFLLPLAMLGVLLLFMLSAQLGVFPERSWWSDILRSTGILFLVHIVVLGLCLGLFAREQDWSLIRRGVLLGAGLFGLGTIVGVGGLGYEDGFLGLPFRQEGFVLGNSTFAGTYLVLAVLLGIIELIRSWSDTKWRTILMATLGVVLLSPTLLHIREFLSTGGDITALMGAARTSSVTIYTFLGFLAGWLLIGKLVSGGARKIARSVWSVGILASITVGVGLLFVPGSVVQEQYIEFSSAARLIVWESGIEAAQDKLLFGWGPENFNQAFESHHDSRLYLKENLAEIWFDRAHNVFVDTLVSVGVVGLAGIAVTAGVFVWVVVRAFRRGVISSLEAVVLVAVVPVHVLQLQTGFDTIGSYLLVGILFGYGVYLEQQSTEKVILVGPSVARGIAGVLLVAALLSTWFVLGSEQTRQHTLRDVFRAESVEQEHLLIKQSLTRNSDFESFRLTSDSFIAGGLDQIATTQSPETVARIQQTLPLYKDAWDQYITAAPDHYRARINQAYLLQVQTVLGEPAFEEMDMHIQKAYELSPGKPLTYIVDGLSHLYRGDLEGAQARIEAAVAIDPNIALSQAVAEYLEVQKSRFPQIKLFRLESL